MKQIFLLVFGLSLNLAQGQSFPRDYVESRATFRALVEQAGNSTWRRTLLITSARDPDLTIDVAYFKSGGRKLVILQSGIHGIEGYAGAAAQFLFLKSFLQSYLQQKIDVLLVHALDPYGYKYGRRTDEQNINLNRNFAIAPSIYLTSNPGYQSLRYILEPKSAVSGVATEYAWISAQLIERLVQTRFARREITEGMNSGQYQFRHGLNYGGQAPAPPVKLLRGLLEELVPRYEQIVFIDLHTGLGEAGVLHIMLGKDSSPIRTHLQNQLANVRGLQITRPEDAGFFNTTGDVIDFVGSYASQSAQILTMTAEFGTLGTGVVPQLVSAALLVSENQAHFNGCVKAQVCVQIQKDFAELFNPTDAIWQRKVLRRSRQLFENLPSSLQSKAR